MERNVGYVVSNELVKVSSLLPSNRNRSLLVHSLVKEFGLLSTNDDTHILPIRPTPADIKDLAVYHDREYLEHLLSGDVIGSRPSEESRSAEFGLEEDCPTFLRIADYVRLVAGASLSAARFLRENEAKIAICWDGGRHHAQKAQASGFCYIADCVLAILALKRPIPPSPGNAPCKPRVMYLDFDLHFSDGVSQAFYSSSSSSSSPQVLTFSIHHTGPGFFPPSPLAALTDPQDPAFDPFTLTLPLERGASSKTFHRIWPIVERVKDAFQPNYVVVQCGVDGLAGDPYATWNWSLGGEGSLGWCVERICSWPCKVLLLGGGGYNSPNAARAWTYLTSIALDRPLSLDADIPDHGAFPLYAPAFTLDVPPGTTQDQNTDAYLTHVEEVFENIEEAIRERMAASVTSVDLSSTQRSVQHTGMSS